MEKWASRHDALHYHGNVTQRRTTSIRGFLHPACGPILRVRLHAPGGQKTNGLAVLDTGASLSAVDRDVARQLDLPTHGAAQWSAVADTESTHPIAPLRRAALALADDPRLWELDLLEIPRLRHAVEGFAVVALLGWNFLDQCVLTCDGPQKTFMLTLPKMVGAAHRRR